MSPSEYGPFANVVGAAAALVAVFGFLLLKMLGGVKRWSWLISDSPPFVVAAAPRALAVALMAVTYVTISRANYSWFALAAVTAGVLAFLSVMRFERLRKLYVVPIALVGTDGKPLQDKRGKPLFNNVVIGSEEHLRPEAAAALKSARERSGISLRQFMSGYGSSINDPEALWDSGYLAGLRHGLTTSLMYVILLSVMTLFWAAFVIEVAGPRPS